MSLAEDDDEDLESYWKLLRRPSVVKVVSSGKVSNLREGLELAAVKSEEKIRRQLASEEGLMLPLEGLVALCIQTLLESWREGIREHSSGSLLEIVLEDQRLPVGELKDFVRALPRSLLTRLLDQTPVDVASGLHALLAIESHFRLTGGSDYDLRRGSDGVLVVTYHCKDAKKSAIFRLDENFSLS